MEKKLCFYVSVTSSLYPLMQPIPFASEEEVRVRKADPLEKKKERKNQKKHQCLLVKHEEKQKATIRLIERTETPENQEIQ